MIIKLYIAESDIFKLDQAQFDQLISVINGAALYLSGLLGIVILCLGAIALMIAIGGR